MTGANRLAAVARRIARSVRRTLRARFEPTSSPARTRARIGAVIQEKRTRNLQVRCNLGCGSRLHPEWINLDLDGDGVTVFGWDLRTGLPFPDRACDVVYSSHAVEHFDRSGVRRFLEECRRVLRRGGIIRLAVPDLERIARSYLDCLAAARLGEAGSDSRYEWAVIELLDQLVRHESGGEMLKYWCQPEVPEEAFVAQRVGTEYWRARKHCKGRILASRTPLAGDVGAFRLGGEVHQWMYDGYSLGRLLGSCGFLDVRLCRADASRIEDFASFHLDTEPDGTVYKPDSLFIEAQRE